MKRALLSLLMLCCAACATPEVQPYGTVRHAPELREHALIASDGTELPLRSWLPVGKPSAVVIALHGMNDYSRAFELPGEYMKQRGIALYAYDQRGFGAGKVVGIWPGEENLVSDLKDMITLVKQRHPDTKLFVLGESMGGAVAIAAFARPGFIQADGVILSAPAVWGGSSMNPLYRAALWTMAHVMPEHVFTGEGLHILASDNIPMLRELGAIRWYKHTRTDTILGLVRLMDQGYRNMQLLQVPVLLLYGKNDEVIPPEAIYGASAIGKRQLAYYPQGYHLLLRDLHRDQPYGDIVEWIETNTLSTARGEEAAAWVKEMQSLSSGMGSRPGIRK